MAYDPTIWKNDPNQTTPINADNLNKIEEELVYLDNAKDTTSNSFLELGIYGFGSYVSVAGSSHSASKDKIDVNIPQGETFKVSIMTEPYLQNMGLQIHAYYLDGTSENLGSVSPRNVVDRVYAASKDIVQIGLYNSAQTGDVTVSFSASKKNLMQEIESNELRLNFIEKVYHELERNVINVVGFMPFSIVAGHTYYIENRGASGNIEIHTTNDRVTNLQNVGTVNAGSNTTFTATDNAIGFITNASRNTVIYIIDKDGLYFDLKKDVDYSCNGVLYVGTQGGGKYIYVENVDIKQGQKFTISATLVSGTSSDVIIYPNSTSETELGYVVYGTPATFVAPMDITRIVGYMRAFDSAVVESSCFAWSQIGMLIEDVDDLDARVSDLEQGAVHLPDYADTRAESMISTLNQVQTSKSVSIGFITDVHVDGPTESDITQNAMAISAAVLNKIGNNIPMDFVIYNGDYLYNRATQTKAQSIAEYNCLSSKTIEQLKIPCFIGKGNHDVNDIAPSENEYLTDEELYQVFLKYADLGYKGNYGYLDKAYGYFDIPNKKIRCIFVNTVDNPFIIRDGSIVYTQQHAKCVSNEQLNFIADALKFDEDGWGVVFFSHHSLQNGTGINPSGSADNYLTPEHGGTQLLGIINAFRNKDTYSSHVSSGDFTFDVDVDYTNNNSDEIIVLISGHTHADRTDVVNGMRMITSMAASFVYQSVDSEGNPVQRAAHTITETSWDVLTIDRISHKIYTTRYGAGNNREFTY